MPPYPALTKHIHAQLALIQVSSVRMLSVERVLTASHDGTVKMWDVRTDTCVAVVVKVQFCVWNMMTQLEFWQLLGEMCMYFF
jgi:WD40 repeat protein